MKPPFLTVRGATFDLLSRAQVGGHAQAQLGLACLKGCDLGGQSLGRRAVGFGLFRADEAGEALGLETSVSATLAKAMVDGAVDLAVGSEASPEALALRVTSPGGTTAAGLAVLDSGLQQLVTETLKAARDRGLELSKPD